VTGIRFLIAATLLLAASCLEVVSAEKPRESRLFRSLTARNDTTRMRALSPLSADPAAKRASLGDLVAAARRNAKETASDDVVRASTVALIYLIGSTDQVDAETLLVELLDASHTGIAMVSADALGKNKFYGAIEFLKKQIDRPEYATQYAFRFNLVRSLAQMEHPDAVDFLSQLRKNLDGQLRFQIDKLLGEVTISHFQGDQERFEKWQGAEKRESFFKEAAFVPESPNRMRLERQQYYGIDIHAKRLMFIIDHSGSMKKYWGPYTRLERAKGELVRAILELPEDTEFAIVFYSTTVRQWRDGLVMATEDNKREAIQFVRRLGFGDKTNTYGALRRALEFDYQLEAVFLLTDGRPTVGGIIKPPAIIADILHRNRFRHLNFNTIGIAVQGPTETFLRRLAEESNGEFREAD
jgi:hypothetical protein